MLIDYPFLVIVAAIIAGLMTGFAIGLTVGRVRVREEFEHIITGMRWDMAELKHRINILHGQVFPARNE